MSASHPSHRPFVRRIVVWGALATAGVVAVVHAQQSVALSVKPGLWEVVSTAAAGTPPSVDTPGLSDAQKAQMAAMMQRVQAQQQAPSKERLCVSKDASKPVFQPPTPKDTTCSRAIVSGSADAQDSTFECRGQSNGRGETHVDRDTDAAVHGHGTMTIAETHQTVTFTFTGKWVAESCGNVK
jgi:hypothetical protein